MIKGTRIVGFLPHGHAEYASTTYKHSNSKLFTLTISRVGDLAGHMTSIHWLTGRCGADRVRKHENVCLRSDVLAIDVLHTAQPKTAHTEKHLEECWGSGISSYNILAIKSNESVPKYASSPVHVVARYELQACEPYT